MNFIEFVNKTWSFGFCRNLALEARYEIEKIINEMAQGGGEAPHMPYFWDADDYRFLQQFPTELWSNALTWRYNDGLREMFKDVKDPKHIPDGWDTTSVLELPSPSRPNVKWRFGKDDGKPNIYIGLTKLAHKLTDPPKEYKDQKGEGKAYWAGEGPAIGQIDPKQTDPNHPEHHSKYKHGLYNYDLSDVVNVTPEDIDKKSDYEILPLLDPEIQDLLGPNEDPKNNPQVQAAIAKKKAAMKKEPKHTFAGYDVLQKSKASESLGNWVRANGMNLFGELPAAGSKIVDPYTQQQHDVKILDTPEQIKSDVHGQWGGKVPMTVGMKDKINIKVPVYKKDFKFDVVKDGKVEPHKGEIKEYIPILNPVKALPALTLSDAQKEAIRKARGGEQQTVESLGDAQGLLNLWDFLTPEQQEYVKKAAKTPFEVAQAKWNKDPEFAHRYNVEADPRHLYTIGHNPNEKGPERGSFSVPPNLTDDFIKEYYDKIYKEIYVGTVDKDGKARPSKIQQILKGMEKSGRYPKQVIKGLEDREQDLAKFATYDLLGWLDDPRYGIKDDKYGLLKDLPAGKINEKENQRRRGQRVWSFITSMSQIPMGVVPPRRIREKGGSNVTSYDQPVGDNGESGAGNISADDNKIAKGPKVAAKFAFLHSDPGTLPRAGWKTHKMYEKMTIFLSTKRNEIIDKLNGSQLANNDLKKSQDKMEVALQTAQNLYVKYNKELESKFPDPKQREEEVMKLLDQNLASAISKESGELSPEEHESILTKLKGAAFAGQHTPEVKALAKKTYEEFLDELIKNGEAEIPLYNNGNFIYSKPYSLDDLPKNNPGMVVKFIEAMMHSFPELIPDMLKTKGPELYSIVQMHWDVDEEDDKEKFLKFLEKEKGVQNFAPTQPTQQTQQTQPAAAPKPVMAQPQHSMAAKSLDDLLVKATNFGTKAEMEQIITNILSREKEFLANPEEAKKLTKLSNAIRQRSNVVGTQEPLLQQDYILLKNLFKFVGDIGEKLDL